MSFLHLANTTTPRPILHSKILHRECLGVCSSRSKPISDRKPRNLHIPTHHRQSRAGSHAHPVFPIAPKACEHATITMKLEAGHLWVVAWCASRHCRYIPKYEITPSRTRDPTRSALLHYGTRPDPTSTTYMYILRTVATYLAANDRALHATTMEQQRAYDKAANL